MTYYCYAVWNKQGDAVSLPSYSRLIRVEYSGKPSAVIEVLSAPTKVVYTVGERLDLTGLKVRIWTSDGGIESLNGDKLNVTKDPLTAVGEQKIQISYEGATAFFSVTVKESSHTHSFGEWTVTTQADCTNPGIKTRECDCGSTETEEIPSLGHRWDDGTVTKEPTETADGERVFTCTACGETKSEKVSFDAVSTVSDGNDAKDSGGVSLWIVIVVAIVALVCGGGVVALFFLRKKKNS